MRSSAGAKLIAFHGLAPGPDETVTCLRETVDRAVGRLNLRAYAGRNLPVGPVDEYGSYQQGTGEGKRPAIGSRGPDTCTRCSGSGPIEPPCPGGTLRLTVACAALAQMCFDHEHSS